MNPLVRFIHGNQMTQTAFARRYGLPLSTVNGWFHGTRKPSLEEAFRLEKSTAGGIKASAWVKAKSAA